MLSDTKYVALGLVIGISATALLVSVVFISGAGSTQLVPSIASTTPAQVARTAPITASPSPAPTVTPTYTPIPTPFARQSLPTANPLLPSNTPDPVLSTILAGGLIFTGPLSNAEQAALYRASLGYVQTTTTGSRRISKEINGVGYGDPTNICGPLAIAILRDSGLMAKWIKPHDFWLLNPMASTDKRLLAEAFPTDTYSYSRILTPINKVNWRDSPLLPGDFLFIWHGSGGNFDHMLVVSRVDASLRTYAVTNYGTPDGYMISEALLYDPNNSKSGLFYTWTKERDAILGSTGFGGFELWRRRGQ